MSQPEVIRSWRNVFVIILIAVSVGLSVSAAQLEWLPGDLPVAEWVQSISIPLFDEVMRGASGVGWWLPASTITVCAGWALVVLKQRSDAALLVVLVSVSSGMNWVVKQIVASPRPDSAMLEVREEADIVWISQRARSVRGRLLWGAGDTFVGGGGAVHGSEKGNAGRSYTAGSSYGDLKGVPGSPLAERRDGGCSYGGSVFGGTGGSRGRLQEGGGVIKSARLPCSETFA